MIESRHMMEKNIAYVTSGPDFVGAMIGLVLLADLILLGVWLFQKVTKK